MRKTRKVNEEIKTNEFVYCSQRKCIHTECLRHNINTPYNVLIHRKDFMPDKDWNCKYITYTKENINHVT